MRCICVGNFVWEGELKCRCAWTCRVEVEESYRHYIAFCHEDIDRSRNSFLSPLRFKVSVASRPSCVGGGAVPQHDIIIGINRCKVICTGLISIEKTLKHDGKALAVKGWVARKSTCGSSTRIVPRRCIVDVLDDVMPVVVVVAEFRCINGRIVGVVEDITTDILIVVQTIGYHGICTGGGSCCCRCTVDSCGRGNGRSLRCGNVGRTTARLISIKKGRKVSNIVVVCVVDTVVVNPPDGVCVVVEVIVGVVTGRQKHACDKEAGATVVEQGSEEGAAKNLVDVLARTTEVEAKDVKEKKCEVEDMEDKDVAVEIGGIEDGDVNRDVEGNSVST